MTTGDVAETWDNDELHQELLGKIKVIVAAVSDRKEYSRAAAQEIMRLAVAYGNERVNTLLEILR